MSSLFRSRWNNGIHSIESHNLPCYDPHMTTLLIIATLLCATTAPALTLIQRSIGLDSIDWEEGSTELEFGDVNADGHLDLLSVGDHGNPFVNSTEHGIICYLGNGAGSWSVHQYGNFGYGGLGLGDLNLDGHLDVAFGIHHDWASSGLGSKLLGAGLGNGSGTTWTPWDDGMPSVGESWGMFATDLADFDGDGLLDLISQSFGGSNGIKIYRNQGDGNWSYAFGLSAGSVSKTLETGDFNADGNLDFVGTRSTGSIYLGDGAFGFTLRQTGITGSIYSVDVGDVDGDGRDDLVIDHGSAGVKVWRLSPATEIWVPWSDGLPTSNTELVQFGDLTGDGQLDVVTFNGPTGHCYINDGTGWNLDATWTMPSPGEGEALRVDGDVDHDGREDIAVLATKSGFPFYRNQLRIYSPWEEPEQLASRVVKPRGGETYKLGSSRELRWATAVPSAQGQATVDLFLSTTGSSGPWSPIAVGLPDNGIHQWQVDGVVSSDCYFEVRCSTSIDEAIDRSDAPFTILGSPASPVPIPSGSWLGLTIHPNPASGETRISWSRPLGKPSVLSVYDLRGRRVDHVSLSPGEVQFDWQAGGDLAAGNYLVELRSGAMTVTRKLMLLVP